MDSATLSPLAQRYVATCYSLPDRVNIGLVHEYKTSFRDSARQGIERTFDVSAIAPAFPNLARLIHDDIIPAERIVDYFEGLAEPSHNLRMYQFARRLFRKQRRDLSPAHLETRRSVLESVLEHIEGCSVRPANLESGTVWGYRGPTPAAFENGHFGVEEPGPTVVVHGKIDGRPVVVRSVDEDLYAGLVTWWGDRARKMRRVLAAAGLSTRPPG